MFYRVMHDFEIIKTQTTQDKFFSQIIVLKIFFYVDLFTDKM